MSIATVVGRGFGPGASIAFVVTRGYSIGAASSSPPNASLTTRGYGANGSIAGVVTRFYGIGAPVTQPPPPPDTGGAGGVIVGGSFSRKKWRERRDELERQAATAVASIVAEASEAAEQVAADVELAPYAPLLAPYVRKIEHAFESAATAQNPQDAAMHAATLAYVSELIRREIEAQEDEEEALLLLI